MGDRVLVLPQVKDVRWWWIEGRSEHVTKEQSGDQFDRWIAGIREAARAEGIRQAREAVANVDPIDSALMGTDAALEAIDAL